MGPRRKGIYEPLGSDCLSPQPKVPLTRYMKLEKLMSLCLHLVHHTRTLIVLGLQQGSR